MIASPPPALVWVTAARGRARGLARRFGLVVFQAPQGGPVWLRGTVSCDELRRLREAGGVLCVDVHRDGRAEAERLSLGVLEQSRDVAERSGVGRASCERALLCRLGGTDAVAYAVSQGLQPLERELRGVFERMLSAGWLGETFAGLCFLCRGWDVAGRAARGEEVMMPADPVDERAPRPSPGGLRQPEALAAVRPEVLVLSIQEDATGLFLGDEPLRINDGRAKLPRLRGARREGRALRELARTGQVPACDLPGKSASKLRGVLRPHGVGLVQRDGAFRPVALDPGRPVALRWDGDRRER